MKISAEFQPARLSRLSQVIGALILLGAIGIVIANIVVYSAGRRQLNDQAARKAADSSSAR